MTMILEALEQHVEGELVSESRCMCVVGHGYCGMTGGRDGGGGWYACGTKPGVGRMSGDAGVFPIYEMIH